MQDVETRLLEEWKANLDLFKFYEQLKQQRFSHFLTIQTAFIATVALLAKESMGVFSLVPLVALAIVPIAPLFISFYFLRLDARNRAFIETANTKLLLLEDEWKDRFPENHFATYHDQFGVLSLRNAALVESYRAARNLAKDPYETLVQAPSSHSTETSILRLFYWLWILVFTTGILHLIWQLAHAQGNPT
jgi:hypothetical protein